MQERNAMGDEYMRVFADQPVSLKKITEEGSLPEFHTLANREQLAGQLTLEGDIIYQPLPKITSPLTPLFFDMIDSFSYEFHKGETYQ
jgi:hypothetical protein